MALPARGAGKRLLLAVSGIDVETVVGCVSVLLGLDYVGAETEGWG